MNARRLLIFSLIINLGLIGTLAWLAKRRAASGSEPGLTTVKDAPRSAASKAAPVAQIADPAKPAPPIDWQMVESEDYKKYIANLRAIGCPEETIRTSSSPT